MNKSKAGDISVWLGRQKSTEKCGDPRISKNKEDVVSDIDKIRSICFEYVVWIIIFLFTHGKNEYKYKGMNNLMIYDEQLRELAKEIVPIVSMVKLIKRLSVWGSG